jgi:hypothetical protein
VAGGRRPGSCLTRLGGWLTDACVSASERVSRKMNRQEVTLHEVGMCWAFQKMPLLGQPPQPSSLGFCAWVLVYSHQLCVAQHSARMLKGCQG